MLGRQFIRKFVSQSRPLLAEVAPTGGTTLNFRFSTPYEVLFQDKSVYRVTWPGQAGDNGILANHVPTIAQLRPGLVEILETAESEPVKYFVSGGFGIITPESTASITASEAIPVDEINFSEIPQLLTNAESAFERAKEDEEKVEAQIAMDVYKAMMALEK